MASAQQEAGGTERHQFSAEVRQLLNLMIHSLYSHKDVFLRELISNASDALDRLRFLGVTQGELLPKDELQIRLEAEPKTRILRISDNGIGMSRDEVVQNLGTIAKSGTSEFLKATKQKEGAAAPELIGQFGVGFYSVFMVATKVTVLTRRAGESAATRWESTGDGTFSLEAAERAEAGTTIELRLKDVDDEEGLHDYTDVAVLRDLVKRYSDFVSYPIRIAVEKLKEVLDEEGKSKGLPPESVTEDETLNSMKALWTRPKGEVKREEYNEFYRHIAHDANEPLEVIAAQSEGSVNARVLLFVPSQAPFDLYRREGAPGGLKLYVKRVLIMDDCSELLPEWLRFVRGVVDAEDISLNVSREMLQEDRQIRAIRKFVQKKVLDALSALKRDRPDDYKNKFWKHMGAVLKEGLTTFGEQRDKLLELLLVSSSKSDELTSFDDYVGRMGEQQKAIYYLTGASLDLVKKSPHLEGFLAKKVEVLFFTDPVDEFWLQNVMDFKGKTLQPVNRGELDLGKNSDKEAAEQKKDDLEVEYYKDLMAGLKKVLDDDVREVRISRRLTESVACLVGEAYDMTPQMEEMMRRMGQPLPKVKRVLELNPDHPFVEKLRRLQAASPDAPELATYAKLIHGQAVLAEGGRLADPSAYGRLVMDVLTKSVS
jgi:molecular chaperone HtpG